MTGTLGTVLGIWDKGMSDVVGNLGAGKGCTLGSVARIFCDGRRDDGNGDLGWVEECVAGCTTFGCHLMVGGGLVTCGMGSVGWTLFG